MKKLITLALVLTTLTISAFADNTKLVNQKVINSFTRSFGNVEDIRWEIKNDLYKVTFKSGGKEMYAYYNGQGDMIAITRNIHLDQLPLTLSAELKSKFNESWMTDLFEVSANGETAYYATVESATHITIYKAEGTLGWTIFKKEKRK